MLFSSLTTILSFFLTVSAYLLLILIFPFYFNSLIKCYFLPLLPSFPSSLLALLPKLIFSYLFLLILYFLSIFSYNLFHYCTFLLLIYLVTLSLQVIESRFFVTLMTQITQISAYIIIISMILDIDITDYNILLLIVA